MRLSKKYINSIKANIINIFGKNTKVILFGSRVDDAKKGGDIDLYIIPQEKSNLEILYDKKIEFLSKVQLELGEQKIDVVIARDKKKSIEKEALKTGIEL